MGKMRFIDLQIDGVLVKYLSPDGVSITAEVYERIRKSLKKARKHAK